MTAAGAPTLERFGRDYAAHRAAEGRGLDQAMAFQLPYLKTGPFARQWAVRSRTFDAFVARILRPMSRAAARPLAVLDLGAGNGWLCHRVALDGHRAIALDIRDDAVDGLGAAAPFLERTPFERLVAPFDAIPLDDCRVDIALFNASLHYATDLAVTVAEAARVVRPGGRIVILDSPFYARANDGEAMVAEKHRTAAERFGERSTTLLALPFIEYLTHERLAATGLVWRRHRVRYPLWYEARPLIARLRGRRVPSRFDLWSAIVA